MEHPYDSPENQYELKAIVIHGGGAYGGHYHAYIRDELEEGQWGLKVPDKYAAEPKKEQKVVNLGLEKIMEENPVKRATRKAEEKQQELDRTVKETEFNFDECDFPLPYHNVGLRHGWFDFNDRAVTPIPLGKLQRQFGSLNESAYMLIYKRKNHIHKFADPKYIPQFWTESIVTQNVVSEQQREFYKQEEACVELVFQHASLFLFDDESMIKYKVDKGIEEQGFKLKVRMDSTVGAMEEKLFASLKERMKMEVHFDLVQVGEIYRHKSEYCQTLRLLSSLPVDKTLKDCKVEHLSTWIYAEKSAKEAEVIGRTVGEHNYPVELSLRFLGEDTVFHTYAGTTLAELKKMVYERTTFPEAQQSLFMVERGGGMLKIDKMYTDDQGKPMTLHGLKFGERTQLMLEVLDMG